MTGESPRHGYRTEGGSRRGIASSPSLRGHDTRSTDEQMLPRNASFGGTVEIRHPKRHFWFPRVAPAGLGQLVDLRQHITDIGGACILYLGVWIPVVLLPQRVSQIHSRAKLDEV